MSSINKHIFDDEQENSQTAIPVTHLHASSSVLRVT
jgi:hypothetical protein